MVMVAKLFDLEIIVMFTNIDRFTIFFAWFLELLCSELDLQVLLLQLRLVHDCQIQMYDYKNCFSFSVQEAESGHISDTYLNETCSG